MITSCNIGLFADDVVIWKSDEDTTKIENSLNENLIAIQSFAEEHKLDFNSTKSFTCIFTTNRHMFNLQPKIYLKGNLLEITKSPTYLGFTLDMEINSIDTGPYHTSLQAKADSRPKRPNVTVKFPPLSLSVIDFTPAERAFFVRVARPDEFGEERRFLTIRTMPAVIVVFEGEIHLFSYL
ncbi:hypothetical protein AVEN_272408-1 [Araneus ventricosus]|uniref:Reverse transcriptase domain-containing protein n=1 Tax=Araneus ventricosus TaxID=182803 RepID=A0A4Y2MGV9_ARAVE|nr:hypothetical protein AVEN_272408-1 [Araneus ventricosus]